MRGMLAAAVGLAAGSALAHDGHVRPAPAAASVSESTDAPFPGRIGGPFRLTDQFGDPRSEIDPDGRMQLVFFGYAKCPGICSAALPALAGLVDALAARGRRPGRADRGCP